MPLYLLFSVLCSIAASSYFYHCLTYHWPNATLIQTDSEVMPSSIYTDCKTALGLGQGWTLENPPLIYGAVTDNATDWQAALQLKV